jgi:hypothetical protein
MKTDRVRKSPPTARTAEPEVDTYEEISARAYELYVGRGRENGHDLEDWLQAEAEVTAKKTRPAAA